ncbi:NADH-quinone oxidoreductase subunit NuoK [Limnochorda pilosa]|uniref:NADH-quinone oxidoreductase subunit K n=1 Tax=Limnochorda pilosa TaxID=1555112 RepID=A0A0K2SPK9_LIMPI|nr:NADH-quinone oxidoreductase subunit NuoK [Limnochorda pilosa]BAS28937.1 NADH:ubiquinone oxidoreductase subunit K [Limnochorda pilosa]
MPLQAYLFVSLVIFALGAVGLMLRRNPLVMLMCVELMWNAANLAFIAFARQTQAMSGQVFAFVVITVAAAEVAIGLAILVLLFRAKGSQDVDEADLLRD